MKKVVVFFFIIQINVWAQKAPHRFYENAKCGYFAANENYFCHLYMM